MLRNRTALAVILAGLIASVASYAQRPPENAGAAAQLIGRWNLVSLEAVRPNGEVVLEWGAKPTGYLSYGADGFVSVQLVRDPRAATKSRELSSEERKEAFDTYYAYYGTFEVNEKEGFVTHHIKGSLRPYELGTSLKRFFKLSGGRLDLSTAPQQLETGEQRVYRLTWERDQ